MTQTIPEEFKSPFGGVDEQAVNDALEEMIGVDRSFRLMSLWRDCHMHARGKGDSGASFMETRSRHEVAEASFRKKAKAERYPDKAIEHYLKYFV